jgi:hypothetical protein
MMFLSCMAEHDENGTNCLELDGDDGGRATERRRIRGGANPRCGGRSRTARSAARG